jgi:hypothetical protein
MFFKLIIPSLRGAKRRGNPEKVRIDCFVLSVLAMTMLFVNQAHAQDVCALYKPSPDVVPADINADVKNPYSDPIIVPVEIDLIERFDLPPQEGVTLEPSVAGLAIYDDGRVLYNGEDVFGDIETVCSGADSDQIKSRATVTYGGFNE